MYGELPVFKSPGSLAQCEGEQPPAGSPSARESEEPS